MHGASNLRRPYRAGSYLTGTARTGTARTGTAPTDTVPSDTTAADTRRGGPGRLRIAAAICAAAGLLVAGGLAETSAQPLAVMIIAATEGAVALCRAERSVEPFDVVEKALMQLVLSES